MQVLKLYDCLPIASRFHPDLVVAVQIQLRHDLLDNSLVGNSVVKLHHLPVFLLAVQQLEVEVRQWEALVLRWWVGILFLALGRGGVSNTLHLVGIVLKFQLEVSDSGHHSSIASWLHAYNRAYGCGAKSLVFQAAKLFFTHVFCLASLNRLNNATVRGLKLLHTVGRDDSLWLEFADLLLQILQRDCLVNGAEMNFQLVRVRLHQQVGVVGTRDHNVAVVLRVLVQVEKPVDRVTKPEALVGAHENLALKFIEALTLL